LKSTLLDLELKRTDLLTKFDPSYRLVQEVETQIAQTREASMRRRKRHFRDETKDLDPTYEALRAELAKSKTELAALEARAAGTTRLVGAYERRANSWTKEVRQQGYFAPQSQ